jgi:hypothetical protein
MKGQKCRNSRTDHFTFNCLVYKGLGAYQYGNMLAGYSGEYASFITGNPLFVVGTCEFCKNDG